MPHGAFGLQQGKVPGHETRVQGASIRFRVLEKHGLPELHVFFFISMFMRQGW
jgi:hypothetical protein